MRLGLDCKLYYSTADYASPSYTELSNVTDVNVADSMGEFDSSTRANEGFESIEPTLRKLRVSFKMMYDQSDANFVAIRAAYVARTGLDMLVLDGDKDDGDTIGVRAQMKVLKMDSAEPLTEGKTVDVELAPYFSSHPPEDYP